MVDSPTIQRSFRLLAGFFLAVALLAGLTAALVAPASARAEAGVGAVAWGENGYMELGAGYKSMREEQPADVVGLANIASLALGYHFSVALLGDGTLRTWGGNAFGELGNKTRVASGVPTSIGLSGVKAISAGGAHALALLESGTIVNWGDNEFGELGNGQLNPMKRLNRFGQIEATMQGSARPEPVPVPGLKNVAAIASGNGTEFAVLSSGTVLAWGKNDRGQLGTGRIGPQICKSEAGEIPCDTTPEPVVLPNHEVLRGVKAIVAGGEAGYALLTNGHVMAWGSNVRGQLGNGSTENSDVAVEVKNLANVVSLSAGTPDALALLSSGRVMGWGGNGAQELGVQANETCQTRPCIMTPRLIPGLENVSAVSAGRGYTLALVRGKVWALGENEPWGQLGIEGLTWTSTPKPIEGLPPVAFLATGDEHAMAVLQSGPAPRPRFSVVPSGGSLGVTWTISAPITVLRWRTFESYTDGGTWSATVPFGQACSVSTPCSYRISGLPGVPIEVQLLSYYTSKVPVTRSAVATP